ncbi:GRAM domain-containing protein 2B-like isoform X2 [Ruditapes philippinarum]|uniref:GRAM domain-containing protein 2B-like isoform X2 n=1 Tax=Ruditapes philippinarum TaxID=129788 RepID=UPI00295A89C8|nr:GRAM domain-containing protein 2B-like isoform X2 [Ruditapes philippinarum]
MSVQHGNHVRYPLPKKKLDFLRSGSLKGIRLQKSLRKSASLPNTPLSEELKFNIEDNVIEESNIDKKGGADTQKGSKRADPKKVLDESVVVNNRSVDFANLTHRGVSFIMDSTPVLSKSRTQKFHKLFKTVPENEYPVDYFSCAYIGDILLQGNLYVSQNWFCFYSRIRGRGRLLEIPMDSVISITREKTAIIFPNAIGLQTKNDKYAFGSFISRDNTYKFFVSMWKKSQEAKTSEGLDGGCDTLKADRSSSSFAQDGLLGKRDSSFSTNTAANGNLEEMLSNRSQSNSKSDSSDNSDCSICIERGSVDISDINEMGLNDLSVKTDSNSSPVRQVSRRSNKRIPKKLTNTDKKGVPVRKKGTESKALTNDGKRLQFPYSVIHCIDRQKTIMALQTSATKLQKIPRTNLLLAICTLLVLFLMLSAVGLTYKILNLESKISARNVWTEADHNFNRDKTYMNVMGLQSVMRDSTAEHVQNILQANIKILHEINSSLQSLKKAGDKSGNV